MIKRYIIVHILKHALKYPYYILITKTADQGCSIFEIQKVLINNDTNI